MTHPLLPDWRPQLVACDLDGTLLGPDLSFDPDTKAGVAALASAAVAFVVCTGRMFESARRQVADLGLNEGPIVCYGGALVADLATGEWLRHVPVPGDAAVDLVRFARERGRHVNAYVDDRLFVEEDDRWTEWTVNYARVEATVVGDLEPVVAGGSTKLVLAADPEVAGPLAREVELHFAGRLRAATSQPHYVEVNDASASKAQTLEWLWHRRSDAMAGRTVACGDGLNDVDMLLWAAFGIAMREGAEGARRAADVVVPRAALGEVFRRLAAARG